MFEMSFGRLGAKFFLLTFLSVPAHAGNLVGNGGLVINCSGGSGPLTLMPEFSALDFFEYNEEEKGIDSSLLGIAGDAEDIVSEVLLRLSRIDRPRASRYRHWLAKFREESQFQDIQLPRTMDAGRVQEIPDNCRLMQAVIQVTPRQNSSTRYIIDQMIWGKLSRIDQAGLIVHELVVRDAREEALLSTEMIRKFVRFLFSNLLLVSNHENYNKVLASSGLITSSISPRLAAARDALNNVLANRQFRSEPSTQLRNYGKETSDTQLEMYSGRLRVVGKNIEVPMTLKTSADVWLRNADGSRGMLLRSQSTSASGVLRVSELESSPVLFAKFDAGDDAFSTLPELGGVIDFATDKVVFRGHSAGYFDYKIGKVDSVLAKSEFVIEWSVRDGKLIQKIEVETDEINPQDWGRVGSLGFGWPW
jgi:hypothetical protein